MTNSIIRRVFEDLLRDLKVVFAGDCSDIAIVELFFSQMSTDVLVVHLTKHVLPWKEQIKSKDASFLDDEAIFAGLPKSKVDHFYELWKTDKISAENKEVIFEYFGVLVELLES